LVLRWSGFKATACSFQQYVRHVGSRDLVPSNEEWQRGVVLVSVELMVDVVVGGGVVPEEQH
ncbi:unnamed protein product, partial [Musa acuminata subsp. burmannicoides]